MSKHMRLPNGFGQISKIKKPLRNPYRAMVSTGINHDTGHHIQKTIGYYRTYNDAYQALMEYHKDPYAIDNSVSLKDLHDRWYAEWSRNKSRSYLSGMSTAWERCKAIHNIKVRNIRPSHIKQCMDEAPTAATKQNIKVLFNVVLDYALEYGLVEHNYAKNFSGEDIHQIAKPHIAFSEEEMEILWKNDDDPYVRMILIQCYMGWRPQELCNILTKNVNINTMTIVGGMKTKDGTNRIVPIPKKIKGYVMAVYNPETNFLFNQNNGRRIQYNMYARKFDEVIVRLGLNNQHRPHDPRKTFVTMAKRKGLDEYAIKRIVGHSISDITEKIYTERNVDWLRDQIDLV